MSWLRKRHYEQFFHVRLSMFVLLHEIGHALDPKTRDEKFNAQRRHLESCIRLFGAETYKKNESTGNFRRLMFEPEVTAWSFALNTVQNYRMQGIVLEPGVSRKKLVKNRSRKFTDNTIGSHMAGIV